MRRKLCRVALPFLPLLVGLGCGDPEAVEKRDASADRAAVADTQTAADGPDASPADVTSTLADTNAATPTDGRSGSDAVASDLGTASGPDSGDERWPDGRGPGEVGASLSDGGGGTDGAVGPDTQAGVEVGTKAAAARVLLVDGKANTFASYDSNGKLVRDYHGLLDKVTSYDGKPWISLAGRMAHWTTASELITSVYWQRFPTGLRQPVRPSTIALCGDHPEGNDSVALGSMAGDVFASFTVTTLGSSFTLSPQEHYLLDGISVVRVSDQQSLLRAAGADGGVAFSPDDKHFIAAWNSKVAFEIVDLQSGRVTQPELATLPFPFSTDRQHVFVKAAHDSGAVIMVDFGYGETLTQQLWWVDWDGHITALDPSLPQYVFDDFVRFDAAGGKLLWKRLLGPKTPTSVPTGTFAFDLGALRSQPWQDVGKAQGFDSTDCFDGHVATFYGVTGDTLQACDCASGACQKLADLPPMTSEWDPEVVVSPDRDVIAVEYYWLINSRQPTEGGDAQIFRASGEKLATAPSSWISFDQTGTLAMLYDFVKDTADKGVLDLATGKVTWLGGARFAEIVYE